jgi:type II secretory pathway component PulF
MSEVVSNESVEEVTPELESEGQVTEAIEEIESLSEQEIEMLPVDEFGEKYVSVQVNGEEVQVPLKEALSGYQRQADYTRKTQELSEQRRQVQFGGALQEALQNDPKGTLELLKQHYGQTRHL